MSLVLSYSILSWELNTPIIRRFKQLNINSFLKTVFGVLILRIGNWQVNSIYACVILLKCKKDVKISNAFQEILDESWRKANKIWVDRVSEFCNRSMIFWLQDNDVEMHSTHNEGKLLLLKDLLKLQRIKITNTWLQYQNICILIISWLKNIHIKENLQWSLSM